MKLSQCLSHVHNACSFFFLGFNHLKSPYFLCRCDPSCSILGIENNPAYFCPMSSPRISHLFSVKQRGNLCSSGWKIILMKRPKTCFFFTTLVAFFLLIHQEQIGLQGNISYSQFNPPVTQFMWTISWVSKNSNYGCFEFECSSIFIQSWIRALPLHWFVLIF